MPAQEFKLFHGNLDIKISYSDACLFSAFRLHMYDHKSFEIDTVENFDVEMFTV
jgi:hypothetical protein